MRLMSLTRILLPGLVALSAPLIVTGAASAQLAEPGYHWLENYDKSNALQTRIQPPEGFERTTCASGSFCDWLRQVPLKADGSPVRYHTGDVKTHASHYAVLDLDTGSRDLQQCADAVMRLKAEYHYSRSDYSNIHFNFTSGDRVSFDDWRKGRRPVVRGNKVSFTPAKETADNSYKNFRKYMTTIFTYAGTLSLSKEMESVPLNDIRVGDVFILGGLPGHAVMVMDVAKNTDGKKMFLLAQSFMPAQDMHILKNPNETRHGPWYSADFFVFLNTPEWQFSAKDLKRFKG